MLHIKKVFTNIISFALLLFFTCPSNLFAASNTIVVAKSGGNFNTVQAAINSVPNYSSTPITIYIKAGKYKEVVTIPSSKRNLHIIGEDRNTTIITYDNYNAKPNGNGGTYGTGGSASVFIQGSDITVQNLTIENSFVEKGNNGEQAVALNVTGPRVAFNNCNFLGNQDTLLADGNTQYFYNCFIQGDVDFIFGRSQAVFERCNIYSLNRGSTYNNGYITAARTEASKPYGFLFLNCNLLAQSGTANNSVYLGRPWCPSGTSVDKPSVVFKQCSLGGHIKSEGWTSMSGVPASHGRFYEYKNTGAGANTARPQLADWQANNWTKTNVLGGWNPSFR